MPEITGNPETCPYNGEHEEYECACDECDLAIGCIVPVTDIYNVDEQGNILGLKHKINKYRN